MNENICDQNLFVIYIFLFYFLWFYEKQVK